MKSRLSVVILVLTCGAGGASGQEEKVYAITGGTVHTLAGDPIENGTILIRNGRISEVGVGVSIPEEARVLDVSGLEVYPGMMDAVSRLGLTEIGSTAATVDTTELGEYNPQLKAATAVHPSSEHIPVARSNGITHAVSAPGGSGSFSVGGDYGIHGQASLINLEGWTVEEMGIADSVGMMLNWPTLSTERFDRATFSRETVAFSEVREEYEEKVGELEDWMEAARAYARADRHGQVEADERDLKLAALVPVVEGTLPLLVLADEARAIRDAVAFAEAQKVRMVLLGGRDSWKVKELLAERGVPVVLGPTLALPRTDDAPYDRPFTTASELSEAGVRVIFATFNSSNSRLLPYEVGNAVAHGLPHEEGLKGITLYPAELFGVGDELGSLEEGKRANLIVTDGDPLEIRTQILHVFIDGEPASLDNKHLRLYERYRARP